MAQITGTEAPPEVHSAGMGEEDLAAEASQRSIIDAEPPARRKRKIPPAVIIVAIIALVIGGLLVWMHYSTFESTDDAQVDGHINPISARVGGYITKVNVTDNQYVEAGTVLAQI